jgi:hypothetical protein
MGKQMKYTHESPHVLISECIALFQRDILQLKSARDTKSIRAWTTVLKCATTCSRIIQKIESNELSAIDDDVLACIAACRKCILYCYTSTVFANSYTAACKVLELLQQIKIPVKH